MKPLGSLDEIIANPQTGRSGCAICGALSAATIQIKIQKVDRSRGYADHIGSSKSSQRTFCESHAIEVWNQFAELSQTSLKRGGDA